MNITGIENLGTVNGRSPQSTEAALRRAAVEFEAIMLTQLTTALNSSNDDEDSLFGSDGGTGLAKQMFAEQFARTMAESGGIGLSDMILKNFGLQPTVSNQNRQGRFSAPVAAVREIRGSASNAAEEFSVVSTYAGQIAQDKTAEPLENAYLNGQIRDSTRPRIVPNSVSADNMIITPLTNGGSVGYEFPLKGRISSDFGNRFHPIDKTMKFHAGVDIAVPRGTPIAAVADGVVKFAGRKGGYGNVVIISHADGRETFYAHADKLLVEAGQRVAGGQEIAKVGSTGKSTGPHLHFEIRENGKVIDPMKFLSNVLRENAEK